jgi:drug/metabolite transporter (DMT)-like permease
MLMPGLSLSSEQITTASSLVFGEVLGVEKLLGGAVTLFGVYLARRQ